MKKLVSIWAFMIVVTMGVIMVGCGSGLEPKTELLVKQTYFDDLKNEGWSDLVLSDVYVIKYYGTFDDCVVVMMSTKKSMYTQALWKEEVGGVIINYSNGNRILAWKENKFYELQEAFNNEFLTKTNLEIIAQKQNGKQ